MQLNYTLSGALPFMIDWCRLACFCTGSHIIYCSLPIIKNVVYFRFASNVYERLVARLDLLSTFFCVRFLIFKLLFACPPTCAHLYDLFGIFLNESDNCVMCLGDVIIDIIVYLFTTIILGIPGQSFDKIRTLLPATAARRLSLHRFLFLHVDVCAIFI